MAKADDTTNARQHRNASRALSAQTPTVGSSAGSNAPSSPQPYRTFEEAIEAERRRLLQAHGVLRCLYEVLLHAEGEEAVNYAEAAHLVSTLIDESVERLDIVKLRPLLDPANASRGYPLTLESLQFADRSAHKIKEDGPAYVC